MEQLVRNVIGKYNDYVSEAKLYEKWLMQVDDPTMRSRLSLLEVKIAAIEAWLNLLSSDEKLVVTKHLMEGLEWPRVAFEYKERWKREFERTERSLQCYQADALAKIAVFAKQHREITEKLFSDVLTQTTTK